MSDFPKTRHEMRRASYEFLGTANCKGCGADLEWWKTTNGKKIPMNADPAGDNVVIKTHWETCPKRDDFKPGTKSASTPAASSPAKPKANPQLDLQALRIKHNARVAVLVMDDGTFAFWRNGIDAEDLRQDLIAAGNFVRNEIHKKEVEHG